MNRRELLKRILTISLAIPGLKFLQGCAGSQAGSCEDGTSVSVSSNHGHSLEVTASDVGSGSAKIYAMQGSADHQHTVSITAENFESLQNGDPIQVTSGLASGHSHVITVSCA